jgi:hypothetical protein
MKGGGGVTDVGVTAPTVPDAEWWWLWWLPPPLLPRTTVETEELMEDDADDAWLRMTFESSPFIIISSFGSRCASTTSSSQLLPLEAAEFLTGAMPVRGSSLELCIFLSKVEAATQNKLLTDPLQILVQDRNSSSGHASPLGKVLPLGRTPPSSWWSLQTPTEKPTRVRRYPNLIPLLFRLHFLS